MGNTQGATAPFDPWNVLGNAIEALGRYKEQELKIDLAKIEQTTALEQRGGNSAGVRDVNAEFSPAYDTLVATLSNPVNLLLLTAAAGLAVYLVSR